MNYRELPLNATVLIDRICQTQIYARRVDDGLIYEYWQSSGNVNTQFVPFVGEFKETINPSKQK